VLREPERWHVTDGGSLHVVAGGVSDDCNSFVVDGPSVWLRIARIGTAFAFQASTDDERWRLVRHFALDGARVPVVGFLAQSPAGEGCRVVFARISYRAGTLGDLRSGA